MNKALTSDLNLLRTFVLIYEMGSLTRVAAQLHTSQPAVSHALARLRSIVGDPLFVRTEGTMRPTPVAQELFDVVGAPITQIDDAINDGLGFIPERSTHRFSLALTDFGALTILPQLVSLASQTAPGVRFTVQPVETDTLGEDIALGRVDAAIASTRLSGPVESEVVLHGGYGCLAPAGFPETDGRISERDFRESLHAGVSAEIGHTHVARVLERYDALPDPHVTVRNFAMLPPLVAECGLLAIVPTQGIARLIGDLPVKLLGLPFDVPPADVFMHWHPSARASPARKWFLDTLREALNLL